ncbi:GL20547 [Drosophila persimilis]|uniref:GL20547 n=1 Tax=Drosophila persimilis TaxID=7234 RepID=B4G756_DROPE|nr:GL20547 [Drosophila persimilis]
MFTQGLSIHIKMTQASGPKGVDISFISDSDDKKYIIELSPMEIRTFVVYLSGY